MEDDPKKLRQSAEAFALKAYREMPHHRAYALPLQAKVLLGSLARAMLMRRAAENRTNMDEKQPTAHKEFHGLIEALHRSGINILQERPSDPRPLPPPTSPDERAVLAKLDPDLLGWFDRLAKSPYKAIAEMRQSEAERQPMAKIEYNELSHEANPFRRGDQTEIANLVKHDPLLASFCEAEARPVTLNLFGQGRDLTVRGRLIKDPAAGAIVELGEKIFEQWRLEDKAQAAEAKATAKQKLAELSASEPPQPRRIARIGGLT